MLLLYLYLIINALLISQVHSSFGSSPTYSQQGLQGVNGTTVQVSNDESMICAGFDDGTFKIFDIELNQLCSNTSTSNSSIVGSAWMPSFGPVTADSAKLLTVWTTDCQVANQTALNDSITGIGYYESVNNTTGNTSGLITLNFGSYIQQYDVSTFNQLTRYAVTGNETFLDFLYYNDGSNTYLVASNSESKIRVFNMQDGSESDAFDTQSPITMMTNSVGNNGNEILGYAQDNNIYKFTSAGSPYQLGWFASSGSITYCPTTSEFALAWTQTHGIGEYLYSGDQQKQLTGLYGTPQQVVCSSTYLVSIDSGGYVNVYTYQVFKKWIIGLIAGIAVGLVLLVVGVIVFIRLRRKWARQADEEKYRTNKPKKYPRNMNQKMAKLDSINMLQNTTLQTTMRQ